MTQCHFDTVTVSLYHCITVTVSLCHCQCHYVIIIVLLSVCHCDNDTLTVIQWYNDNDSDNDTMIQWQWHNDTATVMQRHSDNDAMTQWQWQWHYDEMTQWLFTHAHLSYCLTRPLVHSQSHTCHALLKRCPARIMWNAYLRIIGVLILMKQWAACSSNRALRRSDSCNTATDRFMKQWAACSSNRALRRSDSCNTATDRFMKQWAACSSNRALRRSDSCNTATDRSTCTNRIHQWSCYNINQFIKSGKYVVFDNDGHNLWRPQTMTMTATNHDDQRHKLVKFVQWCC